MRIAIFTLTRDRLFYTRHCFNSLRQKAGHPYDHYVVDNGSQDGTADWLNENKGDFKKITLHKENLGIAIAINRALNIIASRRNHYDLIIKIDNDCEVVSDDILIHLTDAFESLGAGSKCLLSPRVEGIGQSGQPKRIEHREVGKWTLGVTGHIGGIFLAAPARVYRRFHAPENLPLAKGFDNSICRWMRKRRGLIGYIEELVVNHFETTAGQMKRFPDYFERQMVEMNTPYRTKDS